MHHIKPLILKGNGKKRLGKGFSPEELEKAGLNLQEARKVKLPIDFRRRTAHEDNIEAIKTFAANEKAKQNLKPRKAVKRKVVTKKATGTEKRKA